MTQNLDKLTQIDNALKALVEKEKYNKIFTYYTDFGPHSRENYAKHIEFFRRSKLHSLMGLIGANASGKTTMGSIITYFHLSGKYPEWWEGYKFNQGPITAWAASIEAKQLRALQEVMFGSYLDPGTGVIPKEDLMDDQGNLLVYSLSGTAHCFGHCYIRHYTNGKFDGYSKLEYKTYEQGWEQYQGATRQWIWLDEDPSDPRILAECISRLRGPKGKEGRLLCTFTPTLGFSEVYTTFLPDGQLPPNGVHPDNPERYVMVLSWGIDTPHLTEAWKRSALEVYKKTDPLNVTARTKGVASVGSGRIFPVDEAFYTVAPFQIPEHWPRAYGLDFGWHNTAAVWVVKDPVTGTRYVYSEYKQGEVNDFRHVQAIQAKGKWIPGACDPRSGRRDGGELRADYYRSLGLMLVDAESNPAAGISIILNDLESGQLKVFTTCEKLIKEIRTYRWDPKNPNKVLDKQDDHEIDALRYNYSQFDWIARSVEDEFYNKEDEFFKPARNTGRDNLTGY